MGPDLSAEYWALPSAHHFLQEIGNEVRQGVNLVLVYPYNILFNPLRFALYDSLDRERFLRVEMLDISTAQTEPPFEVIKSNFAELAHDQYLEQSVDNDELPDAIIIYGIDTFSSERVLEWLIVLNRWANASAVAGSRHSLILCLPCNLIGAHKFPDADIRLKYKTLAGFPSSLEMRMLCRQGATDLNAACLWREYILSSLAGNDLETIKLLWDVVYQSAGEIKQQLITHSLVKSVSDEELSFLEENWVPYERGLSLLSSPGERNYNLLSSAFTMYTVEFGEEIHAALLAKINFDDEFIHRIWRGQAALLLPMVDEYRRKICDILTERYGKYWAELDGDILDPPLEMGELYTFLHRLHESHPDKQRYGFGVNLTWRIRNELAHYRPVTYQDYLNFWNQNINLHNR